MPICFEVYPTGPPPEKLFVPQNIPIKHRPAQEVFGCVALIFRSFYICLEPTSQLPIYQVLGN